MTRPKKSATDNIATVADLIEAVSLTEYAGLRDRMRAVILRRQGKTLAVVAQMLGRAVSSVKEWNDRFKAEGFEGLHDRPGRGSRPRLGLEREAQFRRDLERRFLDNDPYTAIQRLQQVRDLLRDEYGVEYSRSGVQALMQRLGFSKIKPRPKHQKRDDAVMNQWKTQDLPLFCANVRNDSRIARSKSGSRTKRALVKKAD